MNYYNEKDEYCARWLANLIDAGEIPLGYVDTRDIRDVYPSDLAGFTSCHFFAGIGVWALALRRAGWADERPVWTGSCPCQPFSAAGKGAGFDDERHLWPDWHHLIATAKPVHVPVFGEQVASPDGLAWLDLVQADMENEGAAFWPVDLCAAGVGAPHIRQRLFFVADYARGRRDPALTGDPGSEGLAWSNWHDAARHRGALRLADAYSPRLGIVGRGGRIGERDAPADAHEPDACAVGHPDSGGTGQQLGDLRGDEGEHEVGGTGGVHEPVASGADRDQRPGRLDNPDGAGLPIGEPAPGAAWDCGAGAVEEGPVNGHWRGATWVWCRDGKARPVESRTEPMADGLAARLGYVRTGETWSLQPLMQNAEARAGRLKGYGNAIVTSAAEAVIRSVM